MLALVLVGADRARARRSRARSARGASRRSGPGSRAAGAAAPARALALAGARLLRRASSAPSSSLPAAVLVYWLARGLDAAPSCRGARRVNSLLGLGARGRGRGRRRDPGRPARACATRAGWTRAARAARRSPANALPGIVIALSLVFFAANYAQPALPDARAARLRLRRPLPAAGARGRRVGARVASGRVSRRRRGRSAAARCATTLTVTVPLDPVRHPRRGGARLPLGDEGAAGDAAAPPDRVRDARDGDLEARPPVGAYSRAALPALLLIAVSAPFVYVLSSRHEPTEVEHG